MCAPQRSPSCQPAAGGYRSRQPGHFLESASLHPPQAALRRFPRRPRAVIEREWGNPSKVPSSHSPFLAVGRSADNKTCGQSKKHHPIGWCFFVCASALTVARSKKNTPSDRMGYSFWKCAAAPVKSLPRPARSALNQEVRQDTGDPNVKETLRQSMYVVENGRHCLHVTYKRVLEKIRKSL